MSNIIFDYLLDSELFALSDSNYDGISINELSKELERYRIFIKDKFKDIENEISSQNGDKIIQNSQSIRVECEDLNKITKASMMIDTYVLNDPIHNVYYDDISLNGYKNMIKRDISENELKVELAKKVSYMKNLLPGIRCDTNYIKFIPFYYNSVYIKPNKVRVPTLELQLDNDMIKWFRDNMIVRNIDENGLLNCIPKLCNRIGISFKENEDMDYFIAQYIRPDFENYIPNGKEYFNWVEQEKIKAIQDTYAYLISKKNMYENLNSNLRVNNHFEKEFYIKENFCFRDAENKELSMKMNFIGLYNITLEKSMELRRRYENEFKKFQEKLSLDISILKTTNDEKIIKEHLEDMKKKYDEECKKIRKRILNLDGVVSRNYLDIASVITIYLINVDSTIKGITTALNTAKIIKNEFTYQNKKKRENPLFYLSEF